MTTRILAIAAIATVAGCVDPDYTYYDSGYDYYGRPANVYYIDNGGHSQSIRPPKGRKHHHDGKHHSYKNGHGGHHGPNVAVKPKEPPKVSPPPKAPAPKPVQPPKASKPVPPPKTAKPTPPQKSSAAPKKSYGPSVKPAPKKNSKKK